MKAKEISLKELQKKLENKTLKYVGCIAVEEINSLKNGYFFLKTQQTDIVGLLFEMKSRDIYVYKENKV